MKPQNICAVFSEKYAIYIGLIIAMFVLLPAEMLSPKVFEGVCMTESGILSFMIFFKGRQRFRIPDLKIINVLSDYPAWLRNTNRLCLPIRQNHVMHADMDTPEGIK
ncbi:hypothetical protein [Chitinophaga pinensis]|uniref:Uncharacterized protein n=1 Tax=Chitinophaga pinensis TaxID=79329 RepID=A0A5C6LMX7_9BACT|nr:hypothetical protein [Chitinophaga pinensis]TWV96820.1 hypothetical protein FEF09_22830 [Chitinophaga pinensis]